MPQMLESELATFADDTAVFVSQSQQWFAANCNVSLTFFLIISRTGKLL
jgi:hypothetical protein